MSLDDEPAVEKQLVLAGAKPRYISACKDGLTLTKKTWVAGAEGKAKTTLKTFATTSECAREFDKTLRGKMREGYAFLRAPDCAARGQIVHESFAPGGGGGAVLDLSLDGRFAATASIGAESSFGSKVHLVDLETGARRIVAEHPGGTHQQFLHAVLFDRTGQNLFYQLNNETWRIALDGSVAPLLISKGTPASFNPHVLHSSFDGSRQRLVVFAEEGVVKVLSEDLAIVCEVPTASPTTECRGASISASGRLLALYIASRGVIYRHEDAKADTTNEVRVWDLETRKLLRTIPFDAKIDDIGIGPGDDQLVVSLEYRQGPVAYDLPTSEERWRFVDSSRDDRLMTAHGWAWSPDGKLLAVGRSHLCLYPAGSQELIELEGTSFGSAACVQFSGDGSRLATVINGTCIVYRI